MSILNVDTLQNRAGVSTAVSLSNLYGGVAAAWIVFSANNTHNCIREAFNVITLVDEASGKFRVIFERSLGVKGNGYVFLGSSQNGVSNQTTPPSGDTTQNRYCQQDGTLTPGDFRMMVHRTAGALDDNYVTMMFFAKT